MIGHEATICFLAFTPCNRRLISAGSDGQFWVWDASSGRPLYREGLDSLSVTYPARAWAALSEHGTRLAMMNASGDLAVWALGDRPKEVFRKPESILDPKAMALSPDARRLAYCDGCSVEVIRLPSGQLERRFNISDALTVELAFLAIPYSALKGQGIGELASALEGLRALMAEVENPLDSQDEVDKDPFLEGPLSLKLLFCVGDKAGIKMWDIDSGREFPPLALPGPQIGFRLETSSRSHGLVVLHTITHSCVALRSLTPEVISGEGDLRALAAGSKLYPYRILWKPGASETVVERAEGQQEVAWFPLPLKQFCTHPDQRTFLGAYGSEIHILRLEGPEYALDGSPSINQSGT